MQITTLPKDDVKRGEIYYISRGGYNTGSEQQADRPGVIVSNDKNNKNSQTLEVVYLTTQPKEVFRRIHENNTMTETQIRKRELWRRYYEEKSRMSNNERRRRGIPMVKRPKRQQYRPPKKKTTKG